MENHLSEYLDEIWNLKMIVNNSGEPMPHILEEIQQLKDRHEREVEKRGLEKANKAFAKLNDKGEKPTKYFGSLEKHVRKSPLLDSLFIENEESGKEELFDQEKKRRKQNNLTKSFIPNIQLTLLKKI